MIEGLLCFPLLGILIWAVPTLWLKLEQKAQFDWVQDQNAINIAESNQSQTEKKPPSLDTAEGLDLLTAHSEGALAQSVEQ